MARSYPLDSIGLEEVIRSAKEQWKGLLPELLGAALGLKTLPLHSPALPPALDLLEYFVRSFIETRLPISETIQGHKTENRE